MDSIFMSIYNCCSAKSSKIHGIFEATNHVEKNLSPPLIADAHDLSARLLFAKEQM
jgi:hypothetical protein